MSIPESPQIAAIRARYQSSLTEKLQLLSTRIDSLSKARDEQASDLARQELRENLHKLAGSSGMYGYDDISLLCRSIMREISNNCVHDVLEHTTKLSALFDYYINRDD